MSFRIRGIEKNVRKKIVKGKKGIKPLVATLRKLSLRDAVKLMKEVGKAPSFYGRFDSSIDGRMLSREAVRYGSIYGLYSYLNWEIKNHNYLQRFLNKKAEFEYFLFFGEFERAKVILNDMEEEFSCSFVLYDLFLKYSSVTDEVISPKFWGDIDENEKELCRVFVSKYSCSSISEFKQKKFYDARFAYGSRGVVAPFLELIAPFLLPIELDLERDVETTIECVSSLTPIDRFYFIKHSFYYYLASDREGIHIPESLKLFLLDAVSTSDNPIWERISTHLNGEYSVVADSLSDDFVIQYSAGKYETTASSYFDEMDIDFRRYESRVKSLHFLLEAGSDYIPEIESSVVGVRNDEGKIEPVRPGLDKYVFSHFTQLYGNVSRYRGSMEFFQNFWYLYFDCAFMRRIMLSLSRIYPFYGAKDYKIYWNLNYLETGYLSDIYCRNNPVNGAVVSNSFNRNDMTEGRAICCLIKDNLHNELFEINEALRVIRNSNEILESECEFLYVSWLMNCKGLEDVLVYVFNSCSSRLERIKYYPVNTVLEYVSGERDIDVLGACFLSICKRSGVRCESYQVHDYIEDLLALWDVRKPSDLISGGFLENELNRYFLEHVCSEDNISDALILPTGFAVSMERLQIIQDLGFFYKNAKRFSNEEKQIIFRVLSKRITVNQERNKLTINFSEIRNRFGLEYKAAVDHVLFYMAGGKNIKEIPADLWKELKETKSFNSKDELYFSLLNKLFESVVRDFVLSDEFGLARCLSSEIRHAMFPNKVRGIFEEANLITMIGENSEYELNEYWQEVLKDRFGEENLDDYNSLLSEFSRAVDKRIFEANNWLDVTLDPKDKVKLFCFAATESRISRFDCVIRELYSDSLYYELEKLGEVQKQIDLIFERILVFVHAEIESMCEVVKRQISECLDLGLQAEVQKLKDNVTSAKVPPRNMISVLDKVSTTITEELVAIESWFGMSDDSEIGAVTLDLCVESSFECIRRMRYPLDININRVNQDMFDEFLDGKESMALVRALISMYQNCLAYGIKAAETHISVDLKRDNEGVLLIVSNSADSKMIEKFNQKNYKEMVEGFNNGEGSSSMLIREGDTGFYKICRYLIDYSNRMKFFVDCDSDTVYQIVRCIANE